VTSLSSSARRRRDDFPSGRTVVVVTDAHAIDFPGPNGFVPQSLHQLDDVMRGFVDDLADHSWQG
jgi:hypothetical protein